MYETSCLNETPVSMKDTMWSPGVHINKVLLYMSKVNTEGNIAYKRLNIECVVCHVTGNICLLVHFSSQTPKTIAICSNP